MICNKYAPYVDNNSFKLSLSYMNIKLYNSSFYCCQAMSGSLAYLSLVNCLLQACTQLNSVVYIVGMPGRCMDGYYTYLFIYLHRPSKVALPI